MEAIIRGVNQKTVKQSIIRLKKSIGCPGLMMNMVKMNMVKGEHRQWKVVHTFLETDKSLKQRQKI
jgi:hypothetical protein